MKKANSILCFGEILWDNLPSGAGPGGAPMNVALHLSSFGIKATVACSIGDNPKGVDLKAFLNESGLRTELVQVHETLPTSEVLVHLDEHNSATYEICEPVAWDEISLDKELIEEAKASIAIVFGSLASRNNITRNILMKLLENDILKIMDVNLRPPYDTEDIVKINDNELITISDWYHLSGTLEERMKSLYRLLNLETLIMTKGIDGASLTSQSGATPLYTKEILQNVTFS